VTVIAATLAALAVAFAAMARRPVLHVRRLGAEVPAASRQAGGCGPPSGRVVAVGSLLRAVTRRPPDPDAARRVGWAAVLGFAGVLVAPPVGAVSAMAAWVAVAAGQRRRHNRQRGAVIGALPEVIDLLAMVVGAGLNVRLALEAVAPRAPPAFRHALAAQLRRARLGVRLSDALDELPSMLGDAVRPLVAALVATDRYGVPLQPALERLASEARQDRRRRAEAAARRVPVKLLFPLVLCVLPAFALLTVVPVLVGTIGSLRPH
jgi:tight adherence protein C